MGKLLTAAAAAAVAMALAGCQNALEDQGGPLTGTWRFTATGYQADPANTTITCGLTTTYVLRQEGNDVEGVSSESTVTCQGPGATGGPLTIGRSRVSGETENGHLHVSVAGNYHCFAELHPTRMEGYMESYWSVGQGPIQTTRSGTCVLEKVSGEGWDGRLD